MSEPKKRRFWQFHLSTAVLLMFCAGLILYSNTNGRLGYVWLASPSVSLGYVNYGWPICFLSGCYEVEYPKGYEVSERHHSPNAGEVIGKRIRFGPPFYLEDYYPIRWQTALAIDVAFAIAILVVVARISEWLIRNREGRKP